MRLLEAPAHNSSVPLDNAVEYVDGTGLAWSELVLHL